MLVIFVEIFERFALNPLINRRASACEKKIKTGTYPSTIIIIDFHVNS